MDIIIQSLGFKAGDSLETFIREKVSSLKSGDIVRANVTLFKGLLEILRATTARYVWKYPVMIIL